MPTPEEQITQLESAMAALEAQRATLGDAVVEAALGPMRQQLAALSSPPQAGGKEGGLQGERKLVTVMFADISGFTALAETMDPEAVRDLMNACFEHLVPVVKKYEGTVDKFIGDEIMALFGAPVAHENDPERALRAALDMMDALTRFNTERGTELGLHFGINTGLVIAGGLGTRERQEYSVMGDAVNLAARLEDASERGEILVGPDTYRLAAPLFEFEALEPIRVKGKAEPVPVYRLLAIRVVPGRKVRGIAGLESPLVGREPEFRALQQAVERLQASVGGIVTLVGEAGLGKSRLVAELREKQDQSPISNLQSPTWVEGRCLSYGASIAYLPCLEVLRGLLGVPWDFIEVLIEREAPVAIQAALRERVQALCPGRFEEVYPYLGRLLSLPLEAEIEDKLQELDGGQLRRSTFQAVESLIEGATRQEGPLVIVCEDLHWADPTSLELLERLLALTNRTPLLFMCVFRPETEHGCWQIKETAARLYRHRHIDLWLNPLSAGESESLVENLLGIEALPPQLKARVLDHAEGNPFYVEEIIRSLMDSGATGRDEASGHWQAIRDVADIAIPDTLHGVLMARIDRLQEETKRVLQLASVIGRVFFYRVLAAIAREEHQLDERLLTLQQEEMIRERARLPELEYIFKHHLTQEAAYNGLLRKERRAFHRQVAEALECFFPDRFEEHVGLLAYHWERAEEPDAKRATEYLLRAGDQARLVYANAEAIDYYQRALALLKERKDHERAARALMRLGLTYHNAFDFKAARQAYDEGFILWQRVGEIQEGASLPPPAPHALRVAMAEPVTLGPGLTPDFSSGVVAEQLFSGLVELSPEMNVVPDVARSWEVLEGGRKYVFHLRDDVRWSDGTPVTAGDFEYAWKRVLDPAGGPHLPSYLYDIQGARAYHRGEVAGPDSVGVRALDEVTLVVDLEKPTGHFLYLLAYDLTFPVPQHVVQAHGEAWMESGNIVTNGPFRLAAWERGESLVLERNPTYHGRFTGNLQRVEWSFLSGGSPRFLQLYEEDHLDNLGLSSLPSADWDRARQRHAGEHVSGPWLATGYVVFNVSRPPFDDIRVRQAFTLAIDRERLAGVTLRCYYFPATGGLVPPGMPGHSPGISLPCDLEGACQLLAEAGYPGGRGLPVIDALVPDTSKFVSITEYLQAQWQEVLGVEITWKRMVWEKLLDRVDKETPPMWYGGWLADYPDPDSFLRVSPWKDNARWQNEAYDGLVEAARQVSDQGKRVKMYQQADRLLVEEAPILPLVYARLDLLVKSWVRRFPISPNKYSFWKDVIIEPH